MIPFAHTVRALIRGCLEALEFCHSRGVSHGSIGPGCVLLSTLENRDAEKLRVKLDNFGTAVCTPIPVGGKWKSVGACLLCVASNEVPSPATGNETCDVFCKVGLTGLGAPTGLSSSDTVGQEDDCFATGVMLIEAVYQVPCCTSRPSSCSSCLPSPATGHNGHFSPSHRLLYL
jgi:serine/threonine protein kinase